MAEHVPFSLLDEPWIAVRRADGSSGELTLRQAAWPDDAVLTLAGDGPTQDYAILRLLLAVLHRAVDGPRDLSDWRQLAENPAMVREEVDSYLSGFADRFDLRHPETPFFQVAGLRTAKDGVSGLERIIADVPNGSPLFTTRLGRSLERISWAEAARWLVHVHAFDPSGIRSGAVGDPRVKGGRGYPTGTGWVGQIGGVHAVGRSLRDTLLLNLVVPEIARVGGDADTWIGRDLPVWERPPDTAMEDDLVGGDRPNGPVDLYTWQARRVRLVGDDDAVVGLVLAQGDKPTPHNRQHVEPQTAWRYSEPQTKKFGVPTYMPRTHDPRRAFWRGLESLLPQTGAAGARPDDVVRALQPGVVTWLRELVDHHGDVVGEAVRLRAVGIEYGPKSSTIAEVVDDQLDLPAALVAAEGERLRLAVHDAIAATDRAAFAVSSYANNLAAAGGADDSPGPGDRARERFYVAVDGPFRVWLRDLGEAQDVRDAEAGWHRTARSLALSEGEQLAASIGPASFVGRTSRGRFVDAGLAERWFRGKLVEVLPLARTEERNRG